MTDFYIISFLILWFTGIRSLNDMIKREKQQFEKDKEKTNAILINNFKLKYNYQEEESNSSSLRKQYQGITENLKG